MRGGHGRVCALTAATAAAALVVAACSPGDGGEDPQEPHDAAQPPAGPEPAGPEPPAELDAFAELVEPDWTIEVEVVGAPTVAGEYILAYYLDDGALHLGAWSSADREQVWSEEVLLGPSVADSEHLEAVVGDDDGAPYVAFSTGPGQEDSNGWHDLAARHVDGVGAAALDGTYWINSLPVECVDGAGLCVRGWQAETYEDGSQVSILRVSPDGVTADEELQLGPGARTLRGSVYEIPADPEQGRDVTVLGNRDGQRDWEMPLDDVFGPGYHLYLTASSRLVEGSDVLLLSASRDVGEMDPDLVRDAADEATASIDLATGDVQWVVEGASSCVEQGIEEIIDSGVVLVCAFTEGTVTFERDEETGQLSLRWQDVEAELVGLDLATGEELWRHPLDPDAPNEGGGMYWMAPSATISAATTQFVLVPLADGRRFVDRRTGEPVPAPDSVVAGCREHAGAFPAHWPQPHDDAPSHRNAGEHMFPCTLDGRPAEAFSVGAVRSGAVTDDGAQDGLHVVRTREGLLLFDLGPAEL